MSQRAQCAACRRDLDPVSVGQLLQKAATEEATVLPPGPPTQTIVYTAPMPAVSKRKKRTLSRSLALLLLTIAILFSWANRPGHSSRLTPSFTPGAPTLPVITTKQVLPPETSPVVHARHTPVLTSENIQLIASDPGTPLVNGMYYNDFDQQDSLWNTGRDDNSEFILLDGKYTMRGFIDSLSYSSFIKLNMDTDKDFTIAATAAHEGEGSSDPFGIIFCGDEARDAFFVFYITSNGYYSIGTSVNDRWNELSGWTASSNIRQDAEMNTFSIEKRNGLLRFLVNGRLEKILPFTGGFGNYFGLRTDGTQTVSFDQFIVKGSSPVNNP